MPFTLVLVVAATFASSLPSPARAEDSRVRVDMPAPMVRHLLANMRDHLLALTEIQRALGAGDFQRASELAEQRIGLTSLDAHGASHMAGFMPQAMQDIGTEMHRAASRFALVAQEAAVTNDTRRAVGALAEVGAQCVACHAGYRAR